jgi:ABC-type molybdate transport system substrate-binding protein
MRPTHAPYRSVRRPIILTVHPDPAKTKPAVTAFFDFIETAEGQEILAGF